MNLPVFDLHCDTVTELLGRDCKGSISLRRNSLHIDLERGAALPGYAQCFGFFSTTGMKFPGGLKIQDVFWRQVSLLQDAIDKNKDLIRQARTADEIRQNQKNGLISAVFTIEGPANIGFDPAKLEKLHNLGFRMTSLGWNEQNVLTGSHKTGGGLTAQGKAFLKEAQRLGMIIDVSHISDEAFWQIMDLTEKPIVASHSNSRAVWGNSRNLTDDMFKAICSTGGVAGLNEYADFIGEKPGLQELGDHILHFLELDPEGTHLALGGDWDGCDPLPEGVSGIESYPAIAAHLLQRGVGEKILRNIFWDNALGVMETCSM